MAENTSNTDQSDNLEDTLTQDLDSSTRGTEVASSQSMREILRGMFEPSDYVKLTNPFKYSMGWVYANPAKQPKSEQTSGAGKRVYHGVQDKKVLNPGESTAVTGGEAYVAIERMYKRYVQIDGDVVIMFNNPEFMREFIPRVYKGKVDVAELIDMIDNKHQPAPVEVKTEDLAQMRENIADDIDTLGFADEDEPEAPKEIKFKKPVGRPPKNSK
jgi:hypothetical protein